MKIKKTSDKKVMSLTQIVLLLIANFAFAFSIASVYEAKPVSAVVSNPATPVLKCCERLKNGATCQDVVDDNLCQSGLNEGSRCASTSTCRLGCCVNDVEGTFDKNVAQSRCIGANTRWVDDKNCNVPGSTPGCCIIGSTNAFVTQTRCEVLSRNLGVPKEWRTNLNEAQCVALASEQKQGACVVAPSGGNALLKNSCSFTTQSRCIGLGGIFSEDYLCTSSELNTNCEKTDKTKCVEGKDGVYFIDSCGNPANIYDSSRVNDDSYWQRVIFKTESCNANAEDGNAKSVSCGNCNRFSGGICSSALEVGFNPTLGDFYCKDTSCMYNGKNYKNTESWCVYDGAIGNGSDVVGSRHWKYVCSLGKIQVEPCADYRNEICVQTNTFNVPSVDGTTTEEIAFANANCRVNNGRACIQLNTDKGNVSECDKRLDCETRKIDFGDNFKFNVCVPKYPNGFRINPPSSESSKLNEAVCGIASRTCIVPQQKDAWGNCEILDNAKCLDEKSGEEMNNLCMSLGDCGMKVNVQGKISDNFHYKVDGKNTLLNSGYISKLKNMFVPVAGQYAEPGDTTAYLEAAGILGTPEAADDSSDSGSSSIFSKIPTLTYVGAGAAGVGYIAYAAHIWGSQAAIMEAAPGMAGMTGTTPIMGAFSGAMISAGLGMLIGSLLAKATGASPGFATVAAISGAVAALVAYEQYATAIGNALNVDIATLGLCAEPTLCTIILSAAILTMIISLFGGRNDCKPVKVEYSCEAWQPPSGAEDCAKCNGDPLKPCSEYRCESLGAGCEFINKGTTNEMCTAAKDDAGFPVLSPQTIIDKPYKIANLISGGSGGFSVTSLDGGCLESNTPFEFGINSNEPAQCKFDVELKDFTDMASSFGTNGYVYNHSTIFVLPDPAHGESQGLDWKGNLTVYAKCRDRFGHETPNFYKIEMCIKQGPDMTPPRINYVTPANDAMISYNSNDQNVSVYTNEVSECRWSSVDEDFDVMRESFSCPANINQKSAFGYKCDASLPISSGENKFYVRCKDQPWLDAVGRNGERNSNQESFMYVLTKPSSQIMIDWIEPSEDMDVGTIPTTIVLKAQTSGGGTYHQCKYSFSGYENMIEFNDFDFNTLHEQVFDQMTPGRKRIYVQCADETGDVAQGDVRFRITYDSSEPEIARVWQSNGQLTFITTEEAECKYSTENGEFNFETGGRDAGTGNTHTLGVVRGTKYYIKCKDKFGHVPAGSSIVVRAT